MHKGKYVPRKKWLLTREDWERALAIIHVAKQEELTRETMSLVPVDPMTVVFVKNHTRLHKDM